MTLQIFSDTNTAPSGAYPLASPLTQQNQIRDHVPMLDRKVFARTPDSSHDFVCDEQNIVCVTDLANFLQVAWHRRRSGRRTHDRLQEESSNLSFSQGLDRSIQFARARKFACGKLLVEPAVIAEPRCNMSNWGQKRAIVLSPFLVSGQGERTIALFWPQLLILHLGS